MAPAYAVPRMLDRAGLTLQDFDLYEIHEAFAAQVLCTLKAWEDPVFCRERLGRERAARRDRPRASSTSTAARWPPAIRSRRPAGGSSPASRRRCTSSGSGRGADQHLRGRRPGRRRDPRKRRRRTDERPLHAAGQLAGGPDDRRPGRPAAAGAAGAPRARRARSSPAPCSAAAPRGGRARRASIEQRRCGDAGRGRARRPRAPASSVKALVFDATGIADSTELVELQRFFHPNVRRVQRSRPRRRARHAARRPAGRGRRPRSARWRASPARSARRSAAASPCSWSTSPRAPRRRSTRRCASCSRRARPTSPARWSQVGKAVDEDARRSTGSARWPARWRWSPAPRAASARRSPRRSHRDGAQRRPARRAGALPTTSSAVAARLGGETIELDITDADAPAADRRGDPPTGVDVVVHNAGVTRDRTLAKMPEDRWSSLMEINLSSEERINDALLERELLRPERPHRLRLLDERRSPATPARPTTPPRRRA